jgi:LPXTG-site transpeptidase (sortase) family protein
MEVNRRTMKIAGRHLPFAMIGFGVSALSLAVLTGCSGKPRPALSYVAATPGQAVTRLGAHTVSGATPVASAAAPAAPAVQQHASVHDSPLARLEIPRIGVNAPFVTLGIIPGSPTNQMDSPKTKDDVGYYNFSPLPGHGGNTVLGGHVDWYTGQTGVFWDLKKLVPGDEIRLVEQDGTIYRYRVTATQAYDVSNAPVQQIVGNTPAESVTLLTCEGSFSHATDEYNKERVVRAERIG